MTARDQLIAELKRIYFNPPKDTPMADAMADAAIAILGKRK